jgi:BirA family transcriptional regulator, biotin operon repressor / biotin---[acetyl-CoA-carboxylase] ligase
MTDPRETLAFDTRHVGRRVLVYDAVTSTNDLAAEAEPGMVIVADHQTAGRGQYGRGWTERPGTSLLASVVLAPPAELRRPVILTAWAGVAVADAVYQLAGQQAKIKWPNDVLVRGKKVCGILIEQRAATVVGVGLNLNQTVDEFTAQSLPDAASLAMLTGGPIDPRTAIAVLVRHLDDEYDRLMNGERVPLEADWKWRIGLLGRQVLVENSDGSTLTGRLRDMSFDGLELEAGGPEAVCVLKPENIRHLSAV